MSQSPKTGLITARDDKGPVHIPVYIHGRNPLKRVSSLQERRGLCAAIGPSFRPILRFHPLPQPISFQLKHLLVALSSLFPNPPTGPRIPPGFAAHGTFAERRPEGCVRHRQMFRLEIKRSPDMAETSSPSSALFRESPRVFDRNRDSRRLLPLMPGAASPLIQAPCPLGRPPLGPRGPVRIASQRFPKARGAAPAVASASPSPLP